MKSPGPRTPPARVALPGATLWTSLGERIVTLARSLLCAGLALTIFVSCNSNTVQVTSVEILEKGEAGNSNVMLVVTLDRKVPREELARSRIQLRSSPPAELNATVELPGQKTLKSFLVRIEATNLRPHGIFDVNSRETSGPTGIGLDLGLGQGEVWLDLLSRRKHPVLLRAIWDDTNANFVIDQNDHLRLLFNRDVMLTHEQKSVRVPEHFHLTAAEDRLSDGTVPAKLRSGDSPNEVRLILGSGPRLIPADTRRVRPGADGGFETPDSPLEPSGMAIHGTSHHPMGEIVDARNGLGAVSTREVSIELPEGHPEFRTLPGGFPHSVSRENLSATTIFGHQVLICGGMTEGRARNDVFLVDPLAPENPVHQRASLKYARYLHSATALPGADGEPGTLDDFLVIAGGTDGRGGIAEIEIVRLDFDKDLALSVESPEWALKWPRSYHCATALSGNRLLLTGGLTFSKRRPQIVATAELLTFEFKEDGSITATGLPLPAVPRKEHTATRLSTTDPNFDHILVFGGRGVPRARFEELENWEHIHTYEVGEARVLAQPVLLKIATQTGLEVHPLRSEPVPSFDQVRYGHTALALEPESDGRQRVLISGGSLDMPHDPATPSAYLWAVYDPTRLRPRFGDTASSLVIRFDPEVDTTAEVRVLPFASAETRLHHGQISIPGLGALVLGGDSVVDKESIQLATTELFLLETESMVPFSVALNGGRSRFAYSTITDDDGSIHVCLFGGKVTIDGNNEPAGMEVLRLPRFRP